LGKTRGRGGVAGRRKHAEPPPAAPTARVRRRTGGHTPAPILCSPNRATAVPAASPGCAGAVDHRMGWPAMSAAPPMSGSVGDGLHSRYRTLWGGVDEMLDADGSLRP